MQQCLFDFESRHEHSGDKDLSVSQYFESVNRSCHEQSCSDDQINFESRHEHSSDKRLSEKSIFFSEPVNEGHHEQSCGKGQDSTKVRKVTMNTQMTKTCQNLKVSSSVNRDSVYSRVSVKDSWHEQSCSDDQILVEFAPWTFRWQSFS